MSICRCPRSFIYGCYICTFELLGTLPHGFNSRNSLPATNLTFGNWSSSCLFGCLSETRITSSETQNVHLSQPSNSNSRELKQQGQQRFYEQNNSSARASHFLHISLTYTARLRCKVKRPNATL